MLIDPVVKGVEVSLLVMCAAGASNGSVTVIAAVDTAICCKDSNYYEF